MNRTRKKEPPKQAPSSKSKPEKKNFNVLIAVTGSVATVKLIELIKKLKSLFPQTFVNRADTKTYEATISIRVLMTEHSKHFVNKSDIANCISGGSPIEVYDDTDEWSMWKKMGDPVLHIELRKWADLLVIAPLDANTMAKLANGICDNLLTCVVRAWDVAKKLIYCPAMNVHMYEHPITREQLGKLQSFGYLRVDCVEKRLACGDVGLGAMASVDTISDRVVENLLRPIPRLTSPIKSFLNIQPTYPIMSTNDTAASTSGTPSSAVNLMDRLRSSSGAGGQLTSRTTQSSRNSIVNSRNGISPGQSILCPPRCNNHLVAARNSPRLKNINSNANDTKKLVNASQPSKRSNLVKSLKNLKAINSDLSMNLNDDILDKDDDSEDDDNEFYPDASLDLNSNPEVDDSSYDLDPSRLLEQSLATDDDNSFGNGSRRGSLLLNNSSTTPNAPNWTSTLPRNETNFSPLFNTSKFLTMCYVRERNCFNCAICKNDYKNRKSMSRHLREQHVQGNIYKCIPCDVGFKRREKLMKHNRDKHQQ
uniref:Phosphopantothenoylcysteine decarboxylase n=1 Tax=Aceria tosichella TaxID=561515 RepID=A0A6G1SB49_9ACAR